MICGWSLGDFNLPRLHNQVFEAYFPWTLQGHRVQHAWRLMGTEALKIDHLTTHCFKFTEAQDAFDLIYSSPDQYVGVLLDWRE